MHDLKNYGQLNTLLVLVPKNDAQAAHCKNGSCKDDEEEEDDEATRRTSAAKP